MAITSVSGIASGLLPPIVSYKTSPGGTSNSGSFQWASNWYETGYPIAATAYTGGLTGQVITTSTAAYPYPNPASGNSYLARVTRAGNAGPVAVANLMIVDRLWENSGLDRTSTTAQALSSATWPARDINGSTAGEGVYIALEVSTATAGAAGATAITMVYTNSAGAPSKSGSTFFGGRANAPRGQWYVLGLADGDTGVQSVQSITFSASWGTAGVLNLVAFRPLAVLECTADAQRSTIEDAISMAMPRLYDNTILQSVVFAFAGTEDPRTVIEITQG
jgi:hypothetical protein